MEKLSGVINLLQSISDKTFINKQFLGILLKITGIAIITEFAVSICADAGEKAIASKIEILVFSIFMFSFSLETLAYFIKLFCTNNPKHVDIFSP